MSDIGTVTLVVLGVVLIVAGLLITWRRRSVQPAVSAAEPRGGRPSPIGDEVLAAPVSEAIEDLVNQRLAAAGLAGTRVDFGTAADGSLEIWIGDRRHASVDEIQDPRIRQAVEDAVSAYNK